MYYAMFSDTSGWTFEAANMRQAEKLAQAAARVFKVSVVYVNVA